MESNVDPTQALKDTQRENVVLNGVQFVGEEKMNHFVSALHAVAMSANMSEKNAQDVTKRIICSTSRTASGADSFFVLSRIFYREGLLIKPRPEMVPPVRIEMRGSGNSIRVKVSTHSLFGLYRNEDIEEATERGIELPEPWLLIDTVVTENLVFGKKNPVRTPGKRILSISTPEDEPVTPDEVDELF